MGRAPLIRLAGLVLLGLFTTAAAQADPLTPVWLPPELVEAATVSRAESPAAEGYRLLTGSIKKVDNRWRTESELTISGHLTRATYELSSKLSYPEAERALKASLEGLPKGAVLFDCDGVDCGSSHAWANQVFDIRQLYGIDNSQYYAALKVMTAGAVEYAGLYLVQRGNRRIYLQVDRIAPVPSVNDALSALSRYGYWLAAAGGADALDVEAAGELLAAARDRGMRLALVAHDASAGDSGSRLARSEAQAAAAAAQLLKVKLGEIPAFGVGDLAPRPGAPVLRLEWVIHTPAQ